MALKPVLSAAVIAFLFSCVGSRAEESRARAVSQSVSTRVIGVGLNEDLALTDSYSIYHALRSGVGFRYSNGKVRLRLDYEQGPRKNSGVTPELLARSKTVQAWPGLVITEYPYQGTLSAEGQAVASVTSTLTVTRPFGFLSRLLARMLAEHYGAAQENISGTIYPVRFDYTVNGAKETVEITVQAVIVETARTP